MPQSSLPLFAAIGLSIAILTTYPSSSYAYPSYVPMNPNGNNVGRPPVDAIGHVNPQGGGSRNQYGIDFAANNHAWSKPLCLLDSDGDGYTNGFELGDPCCIWVEGKGDPAYTFDISHPGVAKLVPLIRKCNITCSNGVNPCINPTPTATPSPSPTHHNGTITPSPSSSDAVSNTPSSYTFMVLFSIILSTLFLGTLNINTP